MVSGTPSTSRKERWLDICKQSDVMTPATVAQDSILVLNFTSDFRVDWALCLYPQGTGACKVSNKARQIIITKRAGHGNGPFRCTVDAIRVFNTI